MGRELGSPWTCVLGLKKWVERKDVNSENTYGDGLGGGRGDGAAEGVDCVGGEVGGEVEGGD